MTKTYTLNLDEVQLNTVATALSELPFKTAQPVIAELQKQIFDQQQKPEKPVEKSPE